MSSAIAVVAVGGLVVLWLRQRRRLELITRALHELRAPLCAARLACHSAARERGWPAIARVDDELGRAALAVDDLDAARRGRRVASCREAVDTGALLDEVVTTWAPLAWPLRRRVRAERSIAAPVVEADPGRLAQALGNLVGNALEHGAGDVVLTVSVRGGWVRLTVADTGAGLAVGLRTVRRRARGGRGTRGRGLAIAAEVARRHGGRLERSRRHTRVPHDDLAAVARRGVHPAAGVAGAGPGHAAAGDGDQPCGVSRRRRGIVLTGLALVLGGLAASDVAGREAALRERLGPLVAVVVAQRPLGAGARLKAADLGVRRVPRRFAPAGVFAAPQDLIGQRIGAPLSAGADITAAALQAPDPPAPGAPVRQGERVADIVAIGSPQAIVAGTRVDVLVTREAADGSPGRTELALEDVEVLAVRAADTGPGSRGDRHVAASLRVTLRQAVYLAAAQAFASELRLLPRAAGDRRHRRAPLAIGDSL